MASKTVSERIRKRSFIHILKNAAAVLGAVLFILLYPWLSPVFDYLAGQATLLSTALTMPACTIDILRNKYASELSAPDSSSVPPQSPSSVKSSSSSQSAASSPLPSSQSSASLSSQSSTSASPSPYSVPEEFRGELTELNMTGEDSPAFVRWNSSWVRNYTNLTKDEILQILSSPSSLKFKNSDSPKVLIIHTHATEAFEDSPGEFFDTRNSWRSLDNTINMVAVGSVLAECLEDLGISVIHSTTQHDAVSYSGAYDRSGAEIAAYLKKYPTISIVLDVHRDAIVYSDDQIAKTTATVNGKKAAQLMIIAPCDDGSVGVPGWKNNFRFAAELTDLLESTYPGLTRPVFFCYRTYNFASSPGSLLLEFGTNGNTLEEAKYTARLMAPLLAEYIKTRIGK